MLLLTVQRLAVPVYETVRLDDATAVSVRLPSIAPDRLWSHVIVCKPLATANICGTSVAAL